MILKDSLQALAEFWRDFSKEKTGLVGLGFLAVFALLGVFGGLVVPFPDALHHWRDISYWEDNPQAAPPAWVNLFRSRKGVASSILRSPKQTDQKQDDGSIIRDLLLQLRLRVRRAPARRHPRVHRLGPGAHEDRCPAPRRTFRRALRRPDGLRRHGRPARLSRAQQRRADRRLRARAESRPGGQPERGVRQADRASSSPSSDAASAIRPASLKGTYSFTLTCVLADSSNKIVNPSLHRLGRRLRDPRHRHLQARPLHGPRLRRALGPHHRHPHLGAHGPRGRDLRRRRRLLRRRRRLAPHPALRVHLPPAGAALPDRHLGDLQALDLDPHHHHLPLLLVGRLQARLQHGPPDQGGDLRRGLARPGLRARWRIIFRHIMPDPPALQLRHHGPEHPGHHRLRGDR